ncbi:glucose-6-phosphate dehydrogenase [Oleiphilus sp. HI0071]|uniref:glucose-6-phosphate dehydrogenase n=3 Tax=unclassified Oleiphilus TaxID=2631174 RepID=UPI0007C3CE97|nr:glucose-6-phosphate dehydrogenase [Oleiphilus sp. HI0079]KZY60088.1 glucose-6-phosphate dehydrogenase [Oleiphilus sp. HI0065]KZY84293.1 glucose-6-phosphate dehydrogenase [Oleiphilus sp. HI0071]KZZ02395.1 glucose-6-phosphate dehydrogenase [Oleiphilus sp. HI0073]KZZ44852.1 glucose-6-phosphate dehydrogenase [Oleiphilus sp. HI0118]KZZ50772.1 glucose-6-phosphate dehydrogenase [Oleiphilus sp. HI0122]KZZ78084.1 glucose-6-phosphate dehydrogenase [Oleiphilus sp. HI0130]KZZ78929.1 glucose-6-phospha
MRVTENSHLVIFGASGDLTARMLIPALVHLFATKQLPDRFFVLGVSRSKFSDEQYRSHLADFLRENKDVSDERLAEFLECVHYQPLNTSDVADYAKLKTRLAELTDHYGSGENTLYYLATPPSLFDVIPTCLAQNGMSESVEGGAWKRLIVEKPIGYDLASAKSLDKALHASFSEQQIFRIDHYLGKETVQNLLVFRFANGMFEPLWSRNFVEYVEITGAESLGVEGRGGYYEGAGALRDMFQNHLLQVLAMVAMEPPAAINSDSTRDEVVKLLQSLQPLSEHDLQHNMVLGQYTGSQVRGESLYGYREEEGVSPDSRTETYVALKMQINNWRWSGVPFYVRTGKRLPTRVTEVVIHFRPTPHPVFAAKAPRNRLIIRIQPDEGIVMKFGLKSPGAGFEAEEVSMDFHYQDLGETKVLTAYERLLLDALNGDATLFARSDAVQACWEFVEPILRYKNDHHDPALYGYACGTWGPKEAFDLLQRDQREWRFPCKNLADTDYCEL